MNVKAIIFDKDGTLLDFDKFWISVAIGAISDTLKAVSADEVLLDKLLESIGSNRHTAALNGILCSGTYAQMAGEFYKVLKGTDCKISAAAIENIVVDAFHNNISKGRIVPICENIQEVFEELKQRGIKTAVVTTDDWYITKECLDKLGIKKFFCRIYTDNGVNPSKPDPYYINQFCKDEELELSEVIMVGDTLTDMCFAKNGGIKFVGVAKTDEGRCLLEAGADTVIHDISHIFELLT